MSRSEGEADVDRAALSGPSRGDHPGRGISVSVIVPVRDEAESLPELVSQVTHTLDQQVDDDGLPLVWELIIVDDGSSDGSWKEILRAAESDCRVRGLRFRRNFGKSAALAAGFQTARAPIIATLDGDLQDDPAELPAMIARLGEPADLVAGHKAERRDPLSKRLPSRIFNFITSLVTGLRLRDHNCGLKVARRDVFASAVLYGEMHRFFAAISHAQGFRVVEQPVNHRPRRHGSSKYGLERYARGGLDLLTVLTLTRYGRRPAHLFGGLGLILGTAGILILLYLTGVWALTDQGIGNRPLLLMGVLFVLVAVQLTSLGVLAELIISKDAAESDPLRHVIERANL